MLCFYIQKIWNEFIVLEALSEFIINGFCAELTRILLS